MQKAFLRLSIFCSCTLIALSSCRSHKGLNTTPQAPEQSIVFEPIPDKYASMRIPALVVTKKGSLLAFCEARIGTASDWADMDMLMRRSTDGGRTWQPIQVIAARKDGKPTSNPTPIIDKDGTIHLLYQRDYARAYYVQSKDDGVTWTEPTDITYAFEQFKPEYDWKVIAPGPGHAIQLKNGRLLVPVWICNPKRLLPTRSHAPSRIATIYSDDLGKTWKRGEIIPANEPDVVDPSETMAVQLQDGRVMLNIRQAAKTHRRAVSYSNDGISGWTTPVLHDQLFDPICMAGIIRVSGGEKKEKSRLFFTNPNSKEIEKHPRRNLTARISYDEGKTWPVSKVLNEGPSGYSDVAVGPDGTLYCLYETNTTTKGWNYSILLMRLSLDWLTDGKDKLN